MKILILNGPNINLLGVREKEHYGTINYHQLIEKIHSHCEGKDIILDFFQSNSEGALIDKIQTSINSDAIVINGGAYTHTSIAIRDALLAVNIPFIEVHLSNTFGREDFRHHSYFSDVADGVITGLGPHSYLLAIDYFYSALK